MITTGQKMLIFIFIGLLIMCIIGPFLPLIVNGILIILFIIACIFIKRQLKKEEKTT